VVLSQTTGPDVEIKNHNQGFGDREGAG
jgi:hypothetical protein